MISGKSPRRTHQADHGDSRARVLVALTVDLPEDNLWRGQVGTVVEILAGGTAFEVEFSDRAGRTYASLFSRVRVS